MYDTSHLRDSAAALIRAGAAAAGYGSLPVAYQKERSGAQMYVVFLLDDVGEYDGDNSITLEVNVIGPDNLSDDLERISDQVTAELERAIVFQEDLGYYIYKGNRMTIEGSDPHTVRIRMTFELNLYERND